MDKPPLLFTAHLGMLKPANAAAETAMQEVKGRASVKISGGRANERRRSLYWCICALVVPLLNDRYSLTLDEADLHDISRDKLKLVDEITLPSGEVHKRRKSTSARAMSEPERAEYTDRAFWLWSTWTGVPVETLRQEAEQPSNT